MAKRKLENKLIDRKLITEELRLIIGSDTDYITPTGQIYKDYGNNKMFKKSVFINKNNGYCYCNITYPEGQKQRRVHILVAENYVPNPNNFPIVLHLDNDKTNNNYLNLKWGTVQENTKNAYKDGLVKNAKSWDDSQSMAVCQFDLDFNLINKYGSVSEAMRETGMTKTGILYQCNHKLKTKPRKGYYYRFLKEYDEKGFVL